jgi:hypothetical protein
VGGEAGVGVARRPSLSQSLSLSTSAALGATGDSLAYSLETGYLQGLLVTGGGFTSTQRMHSAGPRQAPVVGGTYDVPGRALAGPSRRLSFPSGVDGAPLGSSGVIAGLDMALGLGGAAPISLHASQPGATARPHAYSTAVPVNPLAAAGAAIMGTPASALSPSGAAGGGGDGGGQWVPATAPYHVPYHHPPASPAPLGPVLDGRAAGSGQGLGNADSHPVPAQCGAGYSLSSSLSPTAHRPYSHHDVESLRVALEAEVGMKALQRALAALEPLHIAPTTSIQDLKGTLYPIVGHGNDRAVAMLADLVRAEQDLSS